MSEAVVVTANEERNRYEVTVDEQLAGFITYRLEGDVIVFEHTEIEPDFDGRGIAGKLVRSALEDVREHGDRAVVAECSFVEGWIGKHPEYAVLLADRGTAGGA